MRHERLVSAMTLDVLGVGNAIVDVFAEHDATLAARFGLEHGTMNLVDDATSTALTTWAGWTRGASGGSVANTTVGVVSLGGSAGFVGRVAGDAVGDLFTEDLRRTGVAFQPYRRSSTSEAAALVTGRCLVLVGPDGERTMATYLGAANLIEPDDLEPAQFAAAKVVYLEGYLSDAPFGYDVLRLASDLAAEHGAALALSLSDPFCVERHRGLFLELAARADLLFCNSDEAQLLTGERELDRCLSALSELPGSAVVTRGADGAHVLSDALRVHVPADAVERVVDTTGAGDLYAAGFLYGYTHGRDLVTCARLGALAAGEIVSQLGARPLRPLAERRTDAELISTTKGQ